jgi:hypothetical protein
MEIDVVIDRVDSSGNLTPDKMEVVTGSVDPNSSSLINVTRGRDSTAQVHTQGAIVEPSVNSSANHNDLVDGILVSLNQDGSLRANTVGNENIIANSISQDKVEDGFFDDAISSYASPGVGTGGTSLQVSRGFYLVLFRAHLKMTGSNSTISIQYGNDATPTVPYSKSASGTMEFDVTHYYLASVPDSNLFAIKPYSAVGTTIEASSIIALKLSSLPEQSE